jgi:hypothetical protein
MKPYVLGAFFVVLALIILGAVTANISTGPSPQATPNQAAPGRTGGVTSTVTGTPPITVTLPQSGLPTTILPPPTTVTLPPFAQPPQAAMPSSAQPVAPGMPAPPGVSLLAPPPGAAPGNTLVQPPGVAQSTTPSAASAVPPPPVAPPAIPLPLTH